MSNHAKILLGYALICGDRVLTKYTPRAAGLNQATKDAAWLAREHPLDGYGVRQIVCVPLEPIEHAMAEEAIRPTPVAEPNTGFVVGE